MTGDAEAARSWGAAAVVWAGGGVNGEAWGNTSDTALPPSWLASADSDVNTCLSTPTGLVESPESTAMASTKALSNMPCAAPAPAERRTEGTVTSCGLVTSGLATTTAAPTSATPVVTIGPNARRTAISPLESFA